MGMQIYATTEPETNYELNWVDNLAITKPGHLLEYQGNLL